MKIAPKPWTAAELELALGRAPRPMDITVPLEQLGRERVLVTGAAGSIGAEVTRIMAAAGTTFLATDIEELDVQSWSVVHRVLGTFRPTIIMHLAGAKHAPEGEVDPLSVLAVNAVGTANMIASARAFGARVVTASTCKACDPETAYGASKLLAERLTLAAGGNVARFYNVAETAGNVFELWAELPESAPVPVTACTRFFISLAEATALDVLGGGLGPWALHDPTPVVSVSSPRWPKLSTPIGPSSWAYRVAATASPSPATPPASRSSRSQACWSVCVARTTPLRDTRRGREQRDRASHGELHHLDL